MTKAMRIGGRIIPPPYVSQNKGTNMTLNKIIHMDVDVPMSKIWLEIDDGIFINADSGKLLSVQEIIDNPPSRHTILITKEDVKNYKGPGSPIG